MAWGTGQVTGVIVGFVAIFLLANQMVSAIPVPALAVLVWPCGHLLLGGGLVGLWGQSAVWGCHGVVVICLLVVLLAIRALEVPAAWGSWRLVSSVILVAMLAVLQVFVRLVGSLGVMGAWALRVCALSERIWRCGLLSRCLELGCRWATGSWDLARLVDLAMSTSFLAASVFIWPAS